ncbi:hypothetical protein [Clostridium hydrogenum]|uniref:hypothetical protein n=1 Tax=Clostridium hydrogenum TaxID=2855764 RepID=UPI001F3C3DFA|nr:hypothetical protein [Clostridium hydrogenum]
MKIKKLLVAFAMTAVIGVGVSAYAETTTNTENHGQGLGRITSMRGYDYVSAVLKDKLHMTDKEITDGLNSGKTMYDLAKGKGMSIEEFRKALIEEKSKAIDSAVEKGSVTKEQGESLKANINTNINNCDGTSGSVRRGNGQMSGGNHRGGANCYINAENK